MAYNQKRFRQLGQIAANQEKKQIDSVLKDYAICLQQTFLKAPLCTSNINVLLHLLGFFSDDITPKEKKFFLDLVDKYRTGNVSLGTITNLLRSWCIRFNQDYLIHQSYFEPYPFELQHIENIDSCKVRDFWKE